MINIERINEVIDDYFKLNQDIYIIHAKELMPLFIKEGIFKTNHKDGLPIRKLLRKLDDENKLYLIPSVCPDRKKKNVSWYFTRVKLSKTLIDRISDDLSYLYELPHSSKKLGDGFYSPYKQAHDARLLIVFGNAIIEGHRADTANSVGLNSDISTIELIKKLTFPEELLKGKSLEELATFLNGIVSMRHIIVHGLTNLNANNYRTKIKHIINANLPVDPMDLTEKDYLNIIEMIKIITNIFGAGMVINHRL